MSKLPPFSPSWFSGLATTTLLGAALLPTAAFAQLAERGKGPRLAPPTPVAVPSGQHWVSSFALPPNAATNSSSIAVLNPTAPLQFSNQTLRMVTRLSVGGSQVRVQVSNVFGTTAMTVGAARVGLVAGGANVTPGSDHALTFSGQTAISIPAGGVALSDPVALSVPRFGYLATSLYLPDTFPLHDFLPTAHQTSYLALAGTGDVTAATTFPTLGTTATTAGYFVTGVEVLAASAVPAFVCFGDSITEGYASTDDANRRWPDFFKARLYATGADAGVVDQGIGGGKLLIDQTGPSGLARFDRDVLAQPGVSHVTVLLGINDIGANNMNPEPTVTAQDLITGYRQLIARAHDRGVKIVGCTILPFKGANPFNQVTYYSANKDLVRIAANDFIRNSAEFDGLIDFDRATGSAGDPLTLNPAYDSGDHLHPNDAGYQAMGNAVDLSLFNGFVTLNSVVSRKVHGAGAGTFDLPLPQGLCEIPAIECRGGGSNGAYTLVFSFATPVTSILGAAVAEGTGTVDSTTINANDPTQVTVNLTGVASGQYVTVGLTNVGDVLGNTSSVRATFGVLVGDTGNNGIVNAADVAQTRSLSGQSVTASNFREDINLDGVINAADVAFVRSRSGTSLPTPAPANVNP